MSSFICSEVSILPPSSYSQRKMSDPVTHGGERRGRTGLIITLFYAKLRLTVGGIRGSRSAPAATAASRSDDSDHVEARNVQLLLLLLGTY